MDRPGKPGVTDARVVAVMHRNKPGDASETSPRMQAPLSIRPMTWSPGWHDVATAQMASKPLSTWMTALVDYVRSGEPDLTNRQMALLLMLVYLNPGPHTVRGLARALNVSKPVVTRALNRLGALGYLRRQRDDSDKRNIFVAPHRGRGRFS